MKTVRILDPLQLQLPMITENFASYLEESREAPAQLRDLVKLVASADRFIFTTCEYHHCMPPALANLLDNMPFSALCNKPAGIIAYSTVSDGGQVAADQLRAMLCRLGCFVVPHIMVLYNVDKRLLPGGEPTGSTKDRSSLLNELDIVLEQVEYLGNALRTYRVIATEPLPRCRA
ncbi:unnamed protein product [Dicrocoelium dendriticum]|nr:unnamed protein product [Dicrocoelium dendriticum]